MIDTLYKEEILEHFHDPQNFGELEDFSKKAQLTNPFCGDDVTMFVKVSDSGQAPQGHFSLREGTTMTKRKASITLSQKVISEIGFTGKGCAISVASASILTEHVKGRSVEEVKKMSDDHMFELLGVEVSETRKKCALLGLSALRDCI